MKKNILWWIAGTILGGILALPFFAEAYSGPVIFPPPAVVVVTSTIFNAPVTFNSSTTFNGPNVFNGPSTFTSITANSVSANQGTFVNLTVTGTSTLATTTITSLSIPSFTSGSVLFAGPGGQISQNNSKFFWNDSLFSLNVTGTVNTSNFRLNTSPTNGYVLTSDASGNGTWQTIPALSTTTVRGLFSTTATGLTYTSSTGILSLTAGYNIPLTASTSNWDSFFQTPSSRITAGTNLSWSGNTLNGLATSTILGSISGGTGISFNTSTGVITNIGVTSIAGTPNQVMVTTATGPVVVSLPQDIGRISSPIFAGITATTGTFGNLVVTSTATLNSSLNISRLAVGGGTTTISFASPIQIIGVTSTAVTAHIVLPLAASAGSGRVYTIKDESGGALVNNISVNRSGADTIDGGVSAMINANFGSLSLYSDGVSKWFIY